MTARLALALVAGTACCAVTSPVLAEPAAYGPVDQPTTTKPSEPQGVARTGTGATIVLPANSSIRVVPLEPSTAAQPPSTQVLGSGQQATVQTASSNTSTPPAAGKPASAPAVTPAATVRTAPQLAGNPPPATAPRQTSPTTAAAARPTASTSSPPTATRLRELPESTTAAAVGRPATATPAAVPPGRGTVVARPAPTVAEVMREPSPEAAKLINWVIATRDNADRPFIVIDKVAAELFVFDPRTRTRVWAPVLIGIAKGDDSMPGIGDLELAQIPVSERTTPAGRFMAEFGPALDHEPVLWVDEHNAVSLHAVVTSNPREHRLARLASATPDDNRITFGCINVAADFYSKYIESQFRQGGGVVYVLPETRPLTEVFAGIPGEAAPSARPGKPSTQLASSKPAKS